MNSATIENLNAISHELQDGIFNSISDHFAKWKRYEDSYIEGVVDTTFTNCEFVRTKFSDCKNLVLMNCTFTGCSFIDNSKLIFIDGAIENSSMSGSFANTDISIGGTNISNSSFGGVFTDLRIYRSKLYTCSFNFGSEVIKGDLSESTFDGCFICSDLKEKVSITNNKFANSIISCRMSNCSIVENTMLRCSCRNMSITSSTIISNNKDDETSYCCYSYGIVNAVADYEEYCDNTAI